MGPTACNQAERGVVRAVTVLSVDPIARDHEALGQILNCSQRSLCPDSQWTLTATPTVALALSAIREMPVPILICSCDDRSDSWKELLEAFPSLAHPPLLIVTSRMADERLWAEALNLGAYDVLAKPFDRHEVTRIVSMAWLHWKERTEAPQSYYVATAGRVS